MANFFTIKEYFEEIQMTDDPSQVSPILDVRSPKEFARAHIPGAINLPLFQDEERHIIGIMYKEEGKEKAVRKGLEIIGPKLLQFVEEADKWAKGKKLYIHCWRGGMRSQSMAWLMETTGYEVKVLEGGYKAYRNHVIEAMTHSYNLLVLGGRTGSGKTGLLKGIADLDEQVIDLEALANHKGSAFGHLMESPQPTSEHFENMLYSELLSLDLKKRIWVEDESHSIGRVYVTINFYNHMKVSPVIIAEVDMDVRVTHLVDQYALAEDADLSDALDQIKKRIGNDRHKMALEALAQKDYATVARIALRYYDKAYDYGLEKKAGEILGKIPWDGKDIAEGARKLLDAVNEKVSQ